MSIGEDLAIPKLNQIKKKIEYRWPRICADFDAWNLTRVTDLEVYNRWTELKFTKANAQAIPVAKGVYVFVVKPDTPIISAHNCILYVGKTTNLQQRYKKYFTYSNSIHPSDQKKRRMVVVWKNYLYFNYIVTDTYTEEQLGNLEFDLIDSIVPPLNDTFRANIIKLRRKFLEY